MIYINNTPFYDEPGSCGTCAFFLSGGSQMCPSDKGICTLFSEEHHTYIYPPRRCKKIFKKAFSFPDGARLVITAN